MQNNISNAIGKILEQGTILYPTDTIWGLGCDATNNFAVEKIYSLKKRNKNKSLIVLVSSIDMLKNYVEQIPSSIINFLKTTKKPTTVIYNNPKNLANNLIANDNTIAIRLVKNGFANKLITVFNKPIVSTSANVAGKETPIFFNDISKEIIEKVDYIVDLHQENMTLKASKLIKIEAKNKFKILRD